MRKYKRVIVWLLTVALLLAVAGTAYSYFIARPQCQLRGNAARIALAVGIDRIDHEGVFPADIKTVIGKGGLEDWPRNPFGPGKMQPLASDAPPVPGCFVYVTTSPWIELNGKVLSLREAETCGIPIPTELEYCLVFYGRRPAWRHAPALIDMPEAALAYVVQAHKQIQWDRVALVQRLERYME